MLIIPAVDLIDGKCVRLYQGDYGRQTEYSDDPVRQALEFQAAGFRRLHLVDLQGAVSGKGMNRESILSILAAIQVPVQVGGGIRTSKDISELIDGGVDFLILGTSALERPGLVDQWVGKWGGERFIVSIDLRGGELHKEGWSEASQVTVDEVVERVRRWGMKQVICTDIEQDGTLEKPNYLTYRQLISQLPSGVSLIAAGGISAPAHLCNLAEIGLQGAVIGRALYEGEFSWEEMLSAS
jgi:phosphoribosylformimino-5-aminoimidazole carboxamide ribotide isomerase